MEIGEIMIIVTTLNLIGLVASLLFTTLSCCLTDKFISEVFTLNPKFYRLAWVAVLLLNIFTPLYDSDVSVVFK